MEETYFFDANYSNVNNLDRIVGFDEKNLFKLERDGRSSDFILKPIPSEEIRRIEFSQYRSIYVLLLAVISGLIALAIAIWGLLGEVNGVGIFTIPAICGFFSYVAFTNSKVTRIDFDSSQKKLVYKTSDCFKAKAEVYQRLEEWASRNQIPIQMP